MKLTAPPGGPAWLPAFVRSIIQGLREQWDSPLRLQRLPTASLPSASAWRGSLVFDETTLGFKGSDGSTWGSLGGSGGGVSDGDKGSITVSGSGTVWTIDNDAVTYAKIQNVTDARLLGRSAGSSGDVQELTVSAPLALSGGALGLSGNRGSATVNFGAFPGSSDARTTVTGQTGILSGSRVRAWIEATATTDHSADEHWVETIDVTAGNIVAGTGFTIYAKNTGTLSEPVTATWADTRLAGPGTGTNQPRPNIGGGNGTRLYG